MYQRYSRVLGLCVLFTLPLAARKPGELPKPGLNMFSRDQDQQLGAEAAKEVRTKYKTLDNKFLQDYVKRVGDRLAATKEAAGSKFPFTFTFIVEPTINAFALPGGPMFIQTGLFPALDNEAQLAGVMAHEMSHVILRHGTHEATRVPRHSEFPFRAPHTRRPWSLTRFEMTLRRVGAIRRALAARDLA